MRCKGNRIFIGVTALLLAVCTLMVFTVAPAYAARDWGGTMWKVDGMRKYVGEKSGSWRVGIRAKADGGPSDTIQMGSSKSVSNSVSCTMGISKRVLNATFKFDVSRTWSTTASKTYGLTGKKKGTWWAIKYKPIYKKYKVKSRCYSFINGKWHRTKKTKWIYATRFDHFAYKLSKVKKPS